MSVLLQKDLDSSHHNTQHGFHLIAVGALQKYETTRLLWISVMIMIQQ